MTKSKIYSLFFLSFLLCFSPLLHAKKEKRKETNREEAILVMPDQAGYTINFNNVSIIEYLKFISKIAHLNFIYNEEELAFNITIVSEEETDLVNIMAALVQVLRMNGFDLIEQGNNLVISKTGSAKQIAAVVSTEAPLEGVRLPPIMTRVFKIKNGNPAHIAAIIQPLLSSDAILEVSQDSRRLIITDITQNIEEIQKLLLSLDLPMTSLEIDSYTAHNNSPEELILLANQILTPISEGNPIILVPHSKTRTIFIVSTPFLAEKAFAILEDLDSPPSVVRRLVGAITGQNILIYHIINKPADQLQSAVRQLEETLEHMGPDAQNLLETLSSMKYIRQSHSLLFIGDPQSLAETNSILERLDTPITPAELEFAQGGFFIYKIQQGTEPQIVRSLEKLVENLKKTPYPDIELISAIESMKWIKENNSLIFTGDQQALNKLRQILPAFDIPEHFGKTSDKLPLSSNFFVYKPKHQSGEQLLREIQDVSKNLQASDLADQAFLRTLQSAKWVPSTYSLVFTGDPASLDRLNALLAILDQPSQVFVYKPVHMSAPDFQAHILAAANEMERGGLTDSDLLLTIKTATLVSNQTAVMFTGTQEAISKLKDIIGTFDTEQKIESKTSEFFVYKPQSTTPELLVDNMKNAADDMKKSGLDDPELINALNSAHLVSQEEAVMFTGTPNAIAKIKIMVVNFDRQKEKSKTDQLFIFKPQHQYPQEIIDQANEAAKEMKVGGLADPHLIAALQSGSIVSNGKAVLFTGTPDAISRLQEIVATFDVEKMAEANQFYVFKPVNMNAEQLQKHIEQAADEMEKAGLDDPQLIIALRNSRIVSEGRAIMFTGTASAIEKIKAMVANFDLIKERLEASSEFFVYKPRYISPEELFSHVQTVAENMEGSGLADPYLISTLKNARIVSQKQAVLFTGTSKSIEKVKELLPLLDTIKDEDLKAVGKATFFIYKIKYLSGPNLMKYLLNVASDLETAGSTEFDLIKTLKNMRYVKETNSIIFTGTSDVLERAKSLAEKFDIPSLVTEAPRIPSGYLIYTPRFQSGEQLIHILRDFEQNLIGSGVDDHDFFDVINNLKWMEQTSSILISGREDETQKVYQLLERFDTPTPGIPTEEIGIEAIADMSFLIYKLQYHSGGEILGALKQIGTDLAQVKKQKNENLVDAINSLQWIEITNSLISTGTSDTLAKLKELIKSIDVPLKQVFVEVLVIQTSLNNALDFGLRWGSQGKYRDKFSYATGSFPQNTTQNPDPLIDFQKNLANISDTNTPTGNLIPFSSGFDLGVIGDIILHKGKTYFALGSLVNAIRTDRDTTIVLNQKLITQDNKNSTIFVGQNVPYTGSIVTTISGGGSQLSSNLEYRDIGVNLSITPTVGNNDIVTLDIEEDISSQVDSSGSSVSSDQVQGITTDKAMTKTVVSVPDKHFLILSGQIQDHKTRIKTSVPCLGGLPLIGAAFSENETATLQGNIIIFVRPHIIKSFDVYKEITTRQEDIYRNQAIAEDFDAGLEIVKTPDDE
jgi:type III secretion protein C